jgi:hypothetical protein
MNVFTLNIPSSSTIRTLVYNVKIKEYNNLYTTIFTGKVFVGVNQSVVRIDLEDILWNHKFDGENYFAPTLNLTGDNYVMCRTLNTLQKYWFNEVKVEIPELNVSVSKNVCFFNNNMFNNRLADVANGTVALFMNHQPTAHIPLNAPEGFSYRQLVWNGSFVRNVDGHSTVQQRSNLGVISFSGGAKQYSLNNRVIAKIDQCAKPYYLCWMTNTGGMQCQGFLKSSEVSVNYKNNTRVDMSNFEWLFNQQTRASWKLKSKNLSDADYKAYGELFASPYLILLDMENNRLHYVNITTETYSQKKNEVGKKLIFFEIEVESSEIKVI